ncbi:mechanosensitive ion channel domain-containing protein [Accumulibacter sp.]|uniref:mechanosensitive ion channel domain-containing protein n=1 Tax=Accumulibacter sp. TaxID=2053492 RepID=UPI0025D64C34|nr:mechanosensitive ion channel domain-containing protein [Accumulibacter sp.]MCM8594023.1 mechanosensitive ion channel [Accumulibacter sp.]MDS4048165.1 mechanosensitive ion channel [Accumulibacter sp.]
MAIAAQRLAPLTAQRILVRLLRGRGRQPPRGVARGLRSLGAVALYLLLCMGCLGPAMAQPATAQPAQASAEAAAERVAAIAPADIPSRADADEKFAQSVERRAQAAEKVAQMDQTLSRQAVAIDRLQELTDESDLALLSVQRLESLERHWQLHDRALTQTRAELTRATNAASEDAADLAVRRAAWLATSNEPDLPPALRQRATEIVAQIERAQALLADPLARLIELGRRSSALSAQVQKGVAEIGKQVAELDWRLVTMDTPPLWQALHEAEKREPVSASVRRALAIETASARDHDASRAHLLPALGILTAASLPLVFWLRRRAQALVAAGQSSERALQALSRPWAAWLLLVAAGAMLYGLQGPNLRQQLVYLLAWIPVLGLLQRHLPRPVGPWAYFSALFYLLNAVVSLLAGAPLLYRMLLLGINLLMLATLAWHVLRVRGSASAGRQRLQAGSWKLAAWMACAVLAVAAGANVLGNLSLSGMLVSATLTSSYAALALYTGSRVTLALFQVLLAGPTVARLSARYAASLAPAAVNLGRAVLVVIWLLFTLQAFRIYRPVSSFAMTVLTHEFKLGELSLTLGSLVSFALATWAAFWLARLIRQLLAEDILPTLPLPRGVGNSISSLSYYVVLFLGLLAALAAAGFQVGQLTLVFGALGVGIGFGLQDVVRNFVAGLILMFERPIQRGDTVEVAGMAGQVREIGLRATTVTTFDGADVVVPNGMLLADKLVNWTLTGTSRRISVELSTVYGAEPRRTVELLVDIARSVQGVSPSPAPDAIMTGMTAGTLDFSVRAWTTERADWVQVRSQLAMNIRNGLADAGIEVPLPQRDVHLRAADREAGLGRDQGQRRAD